MLDSDGNGRITKDDIAQVFKNSPDINDEVLNEIMNEADESG
jgi:Ca2+-binding EF-hand superfamily protein